jgi:two-component system, NtrC family, nitrogen regulation response regulator GlnG
MNTLCAASILVVEDDPQQIRLYTQALVGYRLTCVSSASAALAAIGKQPPDLILLDNILQNGEIGVEFLPRLKAAAAHVPVILISGTLDIRAKLNALSGPQSAHYVIEKPVDIDELERTVERALNECGFAETVAALRSLEGAEKIETGDRERLFTERLSRQLELLRRFRRASDKPNISQLAEEFRVDRKTIRRDLHDLVARGQLPEAMRVSTAE